MSGTALVTGITGQDGSYLAELLLAKGYRVHGLVRAGGPHPRIAHIENRLVLHRGDIADAAVLRDVLAKSAPDEIYNLAAQTFIPAASQAPAEAARINGAAVATLLELVRELRPGVRFFQASSAELFGDPAEVPQTETTAFRPRTPYGEAKLAAHQAVAAARAAGLHASSGILFNHESPRRGVEFVTRKITQHAALIKKGKATELRLGNLDARRDWGFAGDTVRAMWLMLQQPQGGDYVVATGVTHTVREFVELAFARAGVDWQRHVVVDEAFYRPAEARPLTGDASKARRVLGWTPEMPFEALVHSMVDADLAS